MKVILVYSSFLGLGVIWCQSRYALLMKAHLWLRLFAHVVGEDLLVLQPVRLVGGLQDWTIRDVLIITRRDSLNSVE